MKVASAGPVAAPLAVIPRASAKSNARLAPTANNFLPRIRKPPFCVIRLLREAVPIRFLRLLAHLLHGAPRILAKRSSDIRQPSCGTMIPHQGSGVSNIHYRGALGFTKGTEKHGRHGGIPVSVPPVALSVLSVMQRLLLKTQAAPAASPPRR